MSKSRQRAVAGTSHEGLRRFFQRLVAPSFGMLGLGRRELIEYVVDLLTRFARSDQLYRLRDDGGQPLETVTELLIEMAREWDSPTPYRFERDLEIRRQCGDYALFMSGLFRAHVEDRELLGYYLEQGRSAYLAVAEHLHLALAADAAVFRELADEFEPLSGALDYMRKVYMRPELHSGPYAEMLRGFQTN